MCVLKNIDEEKIEIPEKIIQLKLTKKRVVKIIIKKLYFVPIMMNIEYVVVFVINYVQDDFKKIILNHQLIQLLFVKNNN